MNKNLKRESQVRIKRLWQQTYFQKTLETNFFFLSNERTRLQCTIHTHTRRQFCAITTDLNWLHLSHYIKSATAGEGQAGIEQRLSALEP